MSAKTIENEILKKLSLLEEEGQNKVLVFIKTLLEKSNTVSSKTALLKLAGTFDETTLNEMSTAIQAGCENIESNEW